MYTSDRFLYLEIFIYKYVFYLIVLAIKILYDIKCGIIVYNVSKKEIYYIIII